MLAKMCPLLLAVTLLFASGSFQASLAGGAEPQVSFTANATSVKSDQPFTLTCKLAGFDPKQGLFTVSFYRTDSLIPFLKFTVTTKSDGTLKTSPVRLWHGIPLMVTSVKYPVYEIAVKEAASAEYYCKLENIATPLHVESKHIAITVA